VGVFLINHVHQLFLEQLGIQAVASLGYSLGEYNHLVHIGALKFEEALRLVDARGRIFDAGPPGLMASVSGLSRDMLAPTLERASATGHVEIGIYSAPSEHIISGEQLAVETALTLLELERRSIGQILEPHTPMHSACFQPAASPLRPHLEAMHWASPSLPYVSTVTGKVTPQATPRLIIEALAQHVYRPIHWAASLEAILPTKPRACVLSLGPGSSLGNLLRGWVRAQSYNVSTQESRKALLKELKLVQRGGSSL
jgi:[acyl-carrier-protein] S-malonyltransferase